MRKLAAVGIGKSIEFLTRSLCIGGGSAAPGLYALKIYPSLIEDFARLIPKNVVITGTNGKTTTARMLAHFAKNAGLSVIRNHTGSNLDRGIASVFIHHSSFINRKLSFDLGIWELDEAAFNSAVLKIKPQIIIFLNAFRDQLDRYGEVDTVVKKWCETLKNIDPKTTILINGDDGNIVKLLNCYRGKIEKFGLENYKIAGEHKKTTMQKLDLEATNIKPQGIRGTSFQLHTSNFQLPSAGWRTNVHLPIPGIYHIYDFLAAFSAGLHLGIPAQKMVNALESYTPAFGRVEKFMLPPSRREAKPERPNEGYIFLIKNPVGATQVFQTIAKDINRNDVLLIALNDNLADGKDVSWIWDTNFEILQNSPRTICSGTRAQDLAVRLKYAGFNPKKINCENSLERAFQQAKTGLKSPYGRLFILPTYTALLGLQHILAQQGVKPHYWKEEH